MPHLNGRSPRRLVPAAALAVAVGVAVGCSGGPKLYPVQGKVYIDDQLVETGETVTGYVVLYPDQAKGNLTQEHVQGNIGPDGSFKVFAGPKEGAPPGWYKVRVDVADTKPSDPYYFKRRTPEKYNEKDKSGIVFEVVENPEPGRYDLKLPGRGK